MQPVNDGLLPDDRATPERITNFCAKMTKELMQHIGLWPQCNSVSPDGCTVLIELYYSQEVSAPTHCPSEPEYTIHLIADSSRHPSTTSLSVPIQAFIRIFRFCFPSVETLVLINKKLPLSC